MSDRAPSDCLLRSWMLRNIHEQKAVKQIKMADLLFVDFALIPSPVRKETQFKLPDNFSDFDFTDSFTDEPFRARFSRAFSSFHIAGRPLFGDPYLKCFTRREGEGRNFNISALRGRNRRLLAAVV